MWHILLPRIWTEQFRFIASEKWLTLSVQRKKNLFTSYLRFVFREMEGKIGTVKKKHRRGEEKTQEYQPYRIDHCLVHRNEAKEICRKISFAHGSKGTLHEILHPTESPFFYSYAQIKAKHIIVRYGWPQVTGLLRHSSLIYY